MEYSHAVVGACMSMCPEGEKVMREREGLLHPLEASEVQGIGIHTESTRRKSFGKSPSKLLLRADPNRIVKEYSRSAAGRCDLDPCNVRPAAVLKRTMLYLLNNVAVLGSPNWIEIYDFVFDRIRAVRQDMTIQGIVGRDAITILEQTVRFHAYASYRLRDSDISEFDPVINKHHLLECLKELLCLYQTNDGPHENQPEFESVYLCDNLGNGAAIAHCLSLPHPIRNHPLVMKCFRASLSVLLKNYTRALRLIHTLKCPTCLCVLSYHLDQLRIGYLQILSHGYSVKNCQFPTGKLSSLLHLSDSVEDADTNTMDLCTSCHMVDWFSKSDSSAEYVVFNRTTFLWPTERRPCPPIGVLDNMLHSSPLSSILVHGSTDCRWGSGVRGWCVQGKNVNSSNLWEVRQNDAGVDGLIDRLDFVSLLDRVRVNEGGIGKSGGEESEGNRRERVGTCRGRGVRKDECVGVNGEGGGRGRGRRDRKKKVGGGGVVEGVEGCKEKEGAGILREGESDSLGISERGSEGVGNLSAQLDCSKSSSSRGRGRRRKGKRGGEAGGEERVGAGMGVGGGFEVSCGRGRGRGRRMVGKEVVKVGGERDTVVEEEEGKVKGETKLENEGDSRFSWEDWSESDLSREINERLEDL